MLFFTLHKGVVNTIPRGNEFPKPTLQGRLNCLLIEPEVRLTLQETTGISQHLPPSFSPALISTQTQVLQILKGFKPGFDPPREERKRAAAVRWTGPLPTAGGD